MFAIYKYECGLKFIGICAKTEEEAWTYIDKEFGRKIYGEWIGANREAFEVKKITVIE